jgi:hypothetical protein
MITTFTTIGIIGSGLFLHGSMHLQSNIATFTMCLGAGMAVVAVTGLKAVC